MDFKTRRDEFTNSDISVAVFKIALDVLLEPYEDTHNRHRTRSKGSGVAFLALNMTVLKC